mmetsp:Transcript_50084/g.119157  ORF Transcript_50084/g.119157 Transcript_50084/m.119157 type:complete len:124 (-) Transcript_50084:1835-2206(-)
MGMDEHPLLPVDAAAVFPGGGSLLAVRLDEAAPAERVFDIGTLGPGWAFLPPNSLAAAACRGPASWEAALLAAGAVLEKDCFSGLVPCEAAPLHAPAWPGELDGTSSDRIGGEASRWSAAAGA